MDTHIIRSTSVILTLVLATIALASCAAATMPSERVATVPAFDTPSGARDAPTHLPSGAAPPFTIDQAVWERLVQGYTTLVLLDTTAMALEETATATAQGDGDPVRHGIHRAIAVGLLEHLETVLRTTAPHPTLTDAFSAALPLYDELSLLVDRWTADGIAAGEVALAIVPIRDQLATLLRTTDDTLAATFGIDPQQFAALRAEANARVRDQMQRP